MRYRTTVARVSKTEPPTSRRAHQNLLGLPPVDVGHGGNSTLPCPLSVSDLPSPAGLAKTAKMRIQSHFVDEYPQPTLLGMQHYRVEAMGRTVPVPYTTNITGHQRLVWSARLSWPEKTKTSRQSHFVDEYPWQILLGMQCYLVETINNTTTTTGNRFWQRFPRAGSLWTSVVAGEADRHRSDLSCPGGCAICGCGLWQQGQSQTGLGAAGS